MKKSAPRWLISDSWGVGADPYNWTLYRRAKKTWRPVGYYPTIPMMLKGLFEKACRLEPENEDLAQHVEAISNRLQSAADAFHAHVHSKDWPKRRDVFADAAAESP